MNDLRTAAQAVLDRWDSPAWEWVKQGPTAALMADLRAALAQEQAEPYAGKAARLTNDRVRVDPTTGNVSIGAEQAEPVQEPVDVGLLEYRGNSVAFIYQKMTAYRTGIDAAWDAFRANGLHPDGKTSLADMIAKHTAPPQRVPLTDEEILRVLMLDPPNPSLWPHLKGEAIVGDVQQAVLAIARAVERAHGIGGHDGR